MQENDDDRRVRAETSVLDWKPVTPERFVELAHRLAANGGLQSAALQQYDGAVAAVTWSGKGGPALMTMARSDGKVLVFERTTAIALSRELVLTPKRDRWGSGFNADGSTFLWRVGDDPDALRGRQFSKVTVVLGCREAAEKRGSTAELKLARQNAMAALRLAPMLWVDEDAADA